MADLRKLARDRPCMVRLPGICNRNPETTVLGHYRLSGMSGMGMKSPDIVGAWCCSDCHDTVDRRSNTQLDRDFVRLAHLEGVVRTINQLVEEGHIKWKKD
jgi:hypothetical protein